MPATHWGGSAALAAPPFERRRWKVSAFRGACFCSQVAFDLWSPTFDDPAEVEIDVCDRPGVCGPLLPSDPWVGRAWGETEQRAA
eukprot:2668496-Alexandrium_andersonii.AAC.1